MVLCASFPYRSAFGFQGDAQLLVEERGENQSFGQGRKTRQSFAQVVRQASSGDESHYLTTQEVMCAG